MAEEKKSDALERYPDAPPRPMNAFAIFLRTYYKSIREKPGAEAPEIQVLDEIAKEWDALDEAGRDPYEALAAKDAMRYSRAADRYSGEFWTAQAEALQNALGGLSIEDETTTEPRAILKVSGILKKFELKRVWYGRKYDIGLRLKVNNWMIDGWYGVQVRSCAKRRTNESDRKAARAEFYEVNTYPNSIVMCVLLNPLTIWLRHGRDLVQKGKTLFESKLPEFTNALCYQEDEKGGVLLNNLEECLERMFDDEEYAYECRPMKTGGIKAGGAAKKLFVSPEVSEVEKLAKSLWEGVQPLTKEFYKLVKAGDKTVQDAIERSRILIDTKK